MILTDTGPIVALLDADDPQHAACLAALAVQDEIVYEEEAMVF